jgi:hypothetical protein
MSPSAVPTRGAQAALLSSTDNSLSSISLSDSQLREAKLGELRHALIQFAHAKAAHELRTSAIVNTIFEKGTMFNKKAGDMEPDEKCVNAIRLEQKVIAERDDSGQRKESAKKILAAAAKAVAMSGVSYEVIAAIANITGGSITATKITLAAAQFKLSI